MVRMNPQGTDWSQKYRYWLIYVLKDTHTQANRYRNKNRDVYMHELVSIHICMLLLLLLLLSRFSRVRLSATPWTAAHQAPPSLGFSRQEHWSGLPFPSSMHESEKWKWSRSVVSNSSQRHGLQPPRLLRPRDFPGKRTGVGCHRLLRHICIDYLILSSETGQKLISPDVVFS